MFLGSLNMQMSCSYMCKSFTVFLHCVVFTGLIRESVHISVHTVPTPPQIPTN